MDKKLLLGIIIILIIGFGVSFWINSQTTPVSLESKQANREITSQNKEISLSSTPIPTPTISPYSLKVESVDANFITLINEKGSKLRLSNNQSKTKVFRQKGGELIPVSLSEVKVGQSVTVNAVIPGRESHIILQ